MSEKTWGNTSTSHNNNGKWQAEIIQDGSEPTWFCLESLCVLADYFANAFARLSAMQNYQILGLLAYFMEQSPWEANRFSASQEIPHFYGNRRFITAFTNACHPSLSWASSIQSIPPHPTSRRSILILSSHLHLGHPSCFFPPRFPHQNPVYNSPSTPIHATCPAHLIFLDFITQTTLGEEYGSWTSSLCSFLDSPATVSLIGPNILNTLNVSHQVSHPHKTTGKIIVLYTLIFKFLDSKLEDKRFCTEW